MHSLNLGKKTEQKLLENYYEYLQQNKKNDLKMTTFVIENKPRLYKLLKERGFMTINLDDKKDNMINKQLKKEN